MPESINGAVWERLRAASSPPAALRGMFREHHFPVLDTILPDLPGNESLMACPRPQPSPSDLRGITIQRQRPPGEMESKRYRPGESR